MKRILFSLLLVIPFFIAGCDDDDNKKINLTSPPEIQLYQGGTHQINATSDYEITYTSEKEFVATVSKTGLVTADYVGETNIILNNGKTTETVKVVVSGKNNLYQTPNLEFGITAAELIAKLGEPDHQDVTDTGYTRIYYADYSSAASSQRQYIIDPTGKYDMVGVYVYISYAESLIGYLEERYVFVTEDEGYWYFVDGYTDSTAETVVCLFELEGGDYFVVSYYAYESSSSKSYAVPFFQQNDKVSLFKN